MKNIKITELRKYLNMKSDKESAEYQSSPYGQLMEAMRSFGKTSGYNDIFIPAMRRVSPTYEKYYQNLLKANEVFGERYPNFK